jgi:hypothetical protein
MTNLTKQQTRVIPQSYNGTNGTDIHVFPYSGIPFLLLTFMREKSASSIKGCHIY